MQTLFKSWRTQTAFDEGGLCLPGLVVSPYYQAGWGTDKTTMLLKCNVLGYGFNSAGVNVQLIASDGSINALTQIPLSVAYSDTDVTVRAAVQAQIATYCTNTFGIQVPDSYDWWFTTPTDLAAAIAAIPTGPASYQAVVSQTGTGAPTAAGAASTYASGTTFTWARTSAGVYTLTASTAVFSTAKTAVVLGPLNNLNGQYTAVVTSSTVITITTAVQSLAVLGLVGFTATPTDAMITKMAVQVLTYA